MKIVLIAAIARNRVIGKDGKLPWHIPEDLKRFKKLTTGHAVIMGRRTFDSIGRPLPDRRNIVLTSRPIPGIETYRTIPEALSALTAESKVFVIGGAQLYAQFLERADELHLTIVDKSVEGDAFFPPYEELLSEKFVRLNTEEHEGYSFETYVRRVTHQEH